MAIGAARLSLSTACMPTTSSSLPTVAKPLMLLMDNAYVHRITRSRRWQLELDVTARSKSLKAGMVKTFDGELFDRGVGKNSKAGRAIPARFLMQRLFNELGDTHGKSRRLSTGC